MKLVVNLNTNICKIYKYSKQQSQLILIKEISHPENKLKSFDLTSDRPGHYKGSESARGSYSPRSEAKEIEINNFAREVAKELNLERNQNEYDELILITPPQMHGLLKSHLNKHVKNLIINNIQKDVVFMKDHELLEFLKKYAEFPNRV